MRRNMGPLMGVGCVGRRGAEIVELGLSNFVLFGVPGHERAGRFTRGFAVPARAFGIDGGEHFLIGFRSPFECFR